ncbi:hypothetical protein IAR55_005916 [Kwoniella newhampshirensis]|uniref:J domain-containing protein n=1 Tax=Kwoniella newhampshirensis TaxID=1651941 RepID=A0AAW0YGP2_9TREE
MVIRSCIWFPSILISPQRLACLNYRLAHSAALPGADSSSDHASSSYIRPGNTESQAHPRKGKQRSDSLAQTYRFPETGKNGGPPDPFEVMALDRSASEQQVKQQYYKLALLLHPDSSHPSSSHDHFAVLNRAYKLLAQPSSRSAYMKTGYGWDLSSMAARTPQDPRMHAEVMRRRQGGAAAWDGSTRRFRDSDAGKGAWGGFDGSQGWRPYEDVHMGFQPTGPGEERYMSNPRFLAVVGVARMVLICSASHNLAQARYEAAVHGRTRREQIRRRVREAEVLRELEKMENGEITIHDVN